jgi:molybdate-binding protein
MGLIREPKNVDFTIKSEPWTKDELKKFREIMKQQRERRAKLKSRLTKKRSKTV